MDAFSQEHMLEFSDGEKIFSENDLGREMYIVQSGAVEVRKRRDDKEIVLATIGKGEFFGEMSLLESLPRSASAYSVGPTRILAIQPGGFLLRIRRDPTLAFEMLQSLSSRLRRVNSLVADVSDQRVVSAITDALERPEKESA